MTTNGGGGGGKDKVKGSAVSFTEGEEVLAYHGPLLYEAKVPLPFPSPSLPTSHSVLGFARRRVGSPELLRYIFFGRG